MDGNKAIKMRENTEGKLVPVTDPTLKITGPATKTVLEPLWIHKLRKASKKFKGAYKALEESLWYERIAFAFLGMGASEIFRVLVAYWRATHK